MGNNIFPKYMKFANIYATYELTDIDHVVRSPYNQDSDANTDSDDDTAQCCIRCVCQELN